MVTCVSLTLTMMSARRVEQVSEDFVERVRKDNVFSVTLCGHELTFHTTWGLFSPKEIDEGTRLLLRHIEVPADADCLDLGCGYGPVGLTLARLAQAKSSIRLGFGRYTSLEELELAAGKLISAAKEQGV